MQIKDWFTLSISLAALCLSIYNFFRSNRNADRQFLIQFTQDVHKWADQVLSVYEAIHAASEKSTAELRKEDFRVAKTRASVLWDSGRLIFPNYTDSKFCSEKESAFRGIRPSILDTMQSLFTLIEGDYRKSGSIDYIFDSSSYNNLQRYFISEVQVLIATRTRYELVQKLLNNSNLDHRKRESLMLAKSL